MTSVKFKNLVVELKDGTKILFSPSCSFECNSLGLPGRYYWCIYDVKKFLVAVFCNKLVKKGGIGYVC